MLSEARDCLLGGREVGVAWLVLWHCVEEIEHKNVDYDVFEHVAGSYFRRVGGCLHATGHIFLLTRAGYQTLLKEVGLWRNWRSRLALARQFGAETVNPGAGADVLAAAQAFSRGRGVDAVIITASTKSDEPVHQAAQMCRQRGRIVLVGVTGLKLSRTDFYQKELSFQVSCPDAPGLYEPGLVDTSCAAARRQRV